MTFEDFKNVLEQYPDLSFDTFSGYYMKKEYTPEAQVCCWIEEDKCVKFFKKIYILGNSIAVGYEGYEIINSKERLNQVIREFLKNFKQVEIVMKLEQIKKDFE